MISTGRMRCVRVRCPKPGRTHSYPLSRAVGDAILRYMREVRPSGFGRALFFTMRAPDPAARPRRFRENRQRPPGWSRHRRREPGNACAAACRGPASSGPGHVDESDRGFSWTPRPFLHRDLRQGQSRGASRGGGSRSGGAGMTLREAIEQYIVWRRAHGAKFTTGANLLRQFLGYADGDAACDAGHHSAGPGLSGGQGSTDPAPREQVLCPCRLLAPCNQPWPCDPLAAAGQRTEIACPGAALHLLARRTAADSLIPRTWRSAGAVRFSSTR